MADVVVGRVAYGVDWKDVLRRTLKTAAASLAGLQATDIFFSGVAGYKQAVITVASAAVTTIWNAVQGWLNKP